MQLQETEEFHRQLAEIGKSHAFVDPEAVIAGAVDWRNDLCTSDDDSASPESDAQRPTPAPVPAKSTETSVRDLDPPIISADESVSAESRSIRSNGLATSDQTGKSNNDRLDKLPESERPRERMREYGHASVSAVELIAIILGSGTKGKNVKRLAEELLVEFDGLGGLSKITPYVLQRINGIGDARADVLTAAFELGRRAVLERVETGDDDYGREMPNSERIAYTVAKQFTSRLRDNAQEEMWISLLDVRNRYRGKARVYIGCCDQLVAKTGEILSRVVERNAPRYVLVHNHPSGRGDPSGADITFTERLVKAGYLLDIELVDHVVIGEDMQSYVSMRERQLVDFRPNIYGAKKLS